MGQTQSAANPVLAPASDMFRTVVRVVQWSRLHGYYFDAWHREGLSTRDIARFAPSSSSPSCGTSVDRVRRTASGRLVTSVCPEGMMDASNSCTAPVTLTHQGLSWYDVPPVQAALYQPLTECPAV